MISEWTSHLKEDEKERFRDTVRNSRHVLERLEQMLDGLESGIDRMELDPRIYDTPNWEMRIAHDNGFKQCLRKIKRIIDLDQGEKK